MEFLPFTQAASSDYLSDESCMQGTARFLCIPRNEEELRAAVCHCVSEQLTYLVSGSRTGFCGSAVPFCDVVISTEKLRSISVRTDGSCLLAEVSCGTPLAELMQEAAKHHCRFLTNPTETTATVGGMLACNAKGPGAFRHGSIARAVVSLTVILPDGTVRTLDRKDSSDAAMIRDLTGSEGHFGTISRCTLSLAPIPAETWGVLFFAEDPAQFLRLLDLLQPITGDDHLECLEFFDACSLRLLQSERETMASLERIPPFPVTEGGAVYAEICGDDPAGTQTCLMALWEIFQASGGIEKNSWAASTDEEIQRFRTLRHALPELINREIRQICRSCPECCKLCMDASADTAAFTTFLAYVRKLLDDAGLSGYLFGHLAECRVQIHPLPRDPDQFLSARTILEAAAAESIRLGGSVLRENGIGKTRRFLYERFAASAEKAHRLQLLKQYDPQNRINPEIQTSM